MPASPPPLRTVLALSLVAPGGGHVAAGRKTLEVRSWRPDRLPMHDLLIVENDRFLTRHGDTDPHGRAVALVDVTAVREWLPEDVAAACATRWEPGHWAWQLTRVRALDATVPVVAARKLYEVQVQAVLLGSWQDAPRGSGRHGRPAPRRHTAATGGWPRCWRYPTPQAPPSCLARRNPPHSTPHPACG